MLRLIGQPNYHIITGKSHYTIATSLAPLKPFQEAEKLLRVLSAACMHHQPSCTLNSIDIQRLMPLAARSWWIQIKSRKGTERLGIARALMYKKKPDCCSSASRLWDKNAEWVWVIQAHKQNAWRQMHDGSLNTLVRQLWNNMSTGKVMYFSFAEAWGSTRGEKNS